jgi:dTDP-4-amino-4,6-dideoxygalactose transaminase
MNLGTPSRPARSRQGWRPTRTDALHAAGTLPDRLADVQLSYERAVAAFPATEIIDAPGVVSFVENKTIDTQRVLDFLGGAAMFNRWANRGPAWHAVSDAYATYFANLAGKRVVPVANGGIALEALANLHSMRAGRPLRWCVSSFSFLNTGRGLFADAVKVDCDDTGVLSLDAVRALDPDSFDGLVVTNPFGLVQDFDAFVAWQRQTGKPLLIDNAAGIGPDVPDVAYQAFSLHHTKPFGVGEGGLAVVPEDEFEEFLGLLEYKPLPSAALPYWINNGKVSELSCASHLVRLETSPLWLPRYHEQAQRILEIAVGAGFRPLFADRVPGAETGSAPAMSLPFVAPHPVSVDALRNDRFCMAKYYKPLARTATAEQLYARLLNVPTHADMAQVPDGEIRRVLDAVLEGPR